MAKEVWWELLRNLALPIIVLLIFLGIYFGYDGGFSKVKEISLGLKDYLPTLGAQKEFGTESVIPSEQETAINSLKETMKAMKESGEENCFAQYTPIPGLGEEKGTTVEMVYDTVSDAGDKGTFFTVRGGAEGAEIIVDLKESLKGIQPCVIAGGESSSFIADNFRSNFLNAEEGETRSPYHQSVQRISFQGNSDENTVSYNGGEQITFQDGGWLFTPGDGVICFFPSATEDAEKGLEPSALGFLEENQKGTTIEEESIPFLIRTGKLPLCTAQKEVWKTYTSLELFDYLPDNFAVKTIRQSCDGFVGKDCSGKFTEQGSCNIFFNRPTSEYPSGDGCLIMSTLPVLQSSVVDPDSSFFVLACGIARTITGQILISQEKNPSNIQILAQDFVRAEATTINEHFNKEWLSLPGTSLLCAQREWYKCNRNFVNQEITTDGRTYVCTEDVDALDTIAWKEKIE
ncbi:hypothetical protein HYX13_02305 [Candidatus Woesearchaeota archaeon]|nr:hypothetical protein [Candidatus Woesearchaeota archaeon]